MEGFKKSIRSCVVPSAAACLTGSGAILAATGYRLSPSHVHTAACICLVSGFAVLLTWTGFFLKADACKDRFMARTAFQWFTIIFLSAIMGLSAAINIPGHFPVEKEQQFDAVVYRVEMQRYNQRAYLHCTDEKGNEFNAIARLQRETKIYDGDRIQFTARPYAYNSKDPSPAQLYFLYRGISASFYLEGASLQMHASTGYHFRNTFREKVDAYTRSAYAPVTASILMALYFGNRDYIQKETLHLFTYAGALHVLAASGLHVGIIACIPLFLGWLLRMGRKTRWTLCLLTVFAYVYCTDMPVSLIRAAIMMGIAVLHILGDQQKNTFNILFITATVILVIFPFEVFNPGFHLSFGATFGILLLYPVLSSRLPALPLGIHRALAVTVAAQLFVIPIIALHMGELNLVSIISNLTIVPGVSMVLVSSLVQPLLLPVPQLAGFASTGIDLMVSLIVKCARLLSSIGGHGTIEGNLSALATGYLALFIPFWPALKKKKRMIAMLAITLIIPVLLLRQHLQTGKVQACKPFTSNGNGSILLSGKGAGIVYGTPGGYEELVKVNTYLRSRSISSVCLYIPRPGYDHLRLAVYAFKKLPVTRLVIHRNFRFSFYFQQLCKMAEADGCKLEIHDFNRATGTSRHHDTYDRITIDDLEPPDHQKLIPLCRAMQGMEDSGVIIL